MWCGHNPQTDWLVESLNSTLMRMIAKYCETKRHDWDDYLTQLLFAYMSLLQENTKDLSYYQKMEILLYFPEAKTCRQTITE